VRAAFFIAQREFGKVCLVGQMEVNREIHEWVLAAIRVESKT
jgi:hypothetical protein